MAGIFFSGGLPCTLTVNAACGIETTGDDCPALYYPPKCNVSVEPLQMNAIISEIANAINAFGDLYDCSRLDNLKAALQKARSICDLPPFADVPDLDDRIAGCFDNTSSTITVQQLVNLVLSQAGGLCDLPQAGGIGDNDLIAGCIGGAEALVSVGTLRGALGGGSISGIIPQEVLFDQWRAGGNWEVSQSTQNRTGFIVRSLKEGIGITVSDLFVATGNGGYQSISQWEATTFLYKTDAEGTAIDGGRQQAIAIVFKRGTQWYAKSGDVILPLGSDDGVIRFRTPGYQRLTIWSGAQL